MYINKKNIQNDLRRALKGMLVLILSILVVGAMIWFSNHMLAFAIFTVLVFLSVLGYLIYLRYFREVKNETDKRYN